MTFIRQKVAMTLIELLAIIVILGIIAAIAVPTISGLIERQTIKADEKTVEAVFEAARLYMTEYPQASIFTMEDLLSSTGGYLSSNPFEGGIDSELVFMMYGQHMMLFSEDNWTFRKSGRPLSLPYSSTQPLIFYQTGFESASSKTAYAEGTMTADGATWNLNEALRGNLLDDKKNGDWAIRGRIINSTTPGSATLLTDISMLTMVSFSYANYGALTHGRLSLWISNNGGASWVSIWEQTATQSTLAQVNVPIPYGALSGIDFGDSLRIQFRFTSTTTNQQNSRMNLDDIIIYHLP